MSHLRLRYVDPERVDNISPIPFPTLDAPMSNHRHMDSDNEDGALRITHSIEQSLDDVQRRLDDVRHQLDDAFHLPSPDEWPPSAA